MKVVILCGGKGTRLREETEFRPKPMVPIGSRPILWHIMKIYAAQGHKDFILCLGYKGDMIKDFFRNYLWMMSDITVRLGDEAGVQFHSSRHEEADWNVTLADTGEETMTAGRIRRIKRYLGEDENFFLTYGDGVGNVDVNAALALHRQHGRTLTLTAVHPPGRFGELDLQGDTVRYFNEKPQVEAGWINGGFLVASRQLFNYLDVGDNVMFEQEPMRRLAGDDQLRAYLHKGFWQPMDTYQEQLYLNRMWSEGRAPWKVW